MKTYNQKHFYALRGFFVFLRYINVFIIIIILASDS